MANMRLHFCACACHLHLLPMNINIKLDNKNMAIYKRKFKLLSVCLSKILEFHNKWLECLENHCICLLDISSKCSNTFRLLRSSGNTQTHTQTDCYNPPPTLGLIKNRMRDGGGREGGRKGTKGMERYEREDSTLLLHSNKRRVQF